MIKKKLIDCFASGKGVFYFLQEFDVPWKYDAEEETGIDSILLDSEYLYNVSGNRFISPLMIYYLDDNEVITDQKAEQLAQIIYALNGKRWARLWETMELEYNPIENYNMHEILSDDDTTVIHGKTTTRTPNTTETDTTEMQGFDSATYKPTDRYTSVNTGTETYADSGNDVTQHGHDLVRTGNIGVTTSQQMIESERNLWYWEFFHDVVFPDINKYLVLSIY